MRHLGALIFRPLLITIGILGFVYPGFLNPSGYLYVIPGGFTRFVIVTMVVGIAVLYGLGGIQADEHNHLATTTASPYHGHGPSNDSFGIPADREPPAPFYMDRNSLLPPGYNARSDTPDRVVSFVHRLFDDQEPERDTDEKRDEDPHVK